MELIEPEVDASADASANASADASAKASANASADDSADASAMQLLEDKDDKISFGFDILFLGKHEPSKPKAPPINSV